MRKLTVTAEAVEAPAKKKCGRPAAKVIKKEASPRKRKPSCFNVEFRLYDDDGTGFSMSGRFPDEMFVKLAEYIVATLPTASTAAASAVTAAKVDAPTKPEEK